jgi:hypothetical protein
MPPVEFEPTISAGERPLGPTSFLFPNEIPLQLLHTLPVARKIPEFKCPLQSTQGEHVVLAKIFGPKGDDVAAEWRKLHNEELRDVLYSSPDSTV